MITYEMIPLGEWEDLKPLYTTFFPEVPFPSPELSCAAVAKDGNKIVAFWFLQLCAHAEPVGIDPAYSGLVNLHALQDALHKGFKHVPSLEYYITSPDNRFDQVLLNNGFKFIGALYSRRVDEDVPSLNH